MVAIDHRSSAHELFEQEGAVFAVNILGQDQVNLSNRFAWVRDEDRFAEGDWGTAVTGAPILTNAPGLVGLHHLCSLCGGNPFNLHR